MDKVFKALADPTRRGLLDQLFEEDGQTLSALGARVEMTRFGVMKHLAVLAEAGKFANDILSPLNAIGDRDGARFKDGAVTTAPGSASLDGLAGSRALGLRALGAESGSSRHRVRLLPRARTAPENDAIWFGGRR